MNFRSLQTPQPSDAGREDIADKALFGTFRRFSYPEIQEATEDFAPENLLGEGGFGMVSPAFPYEGCGVPRLHWHKVDIEIESPNVLQALACD